MKSINSFLSRRRFFTLGCMGALGGFWATQSQSFGARFIRERFAEIGMETQHAKFKPSPSTWNENSITATWLGHSTVLLNFFGITILTDPVLFSRVGADLKIGTLGPRRFIASALSVTELPPIDLILLSHAHLDHFDLPTLRTFNGASSVVTSRKTLDLFRSTELSKVTEIGWGEKRTVITSNGSVEVEAFEVNHWGARWKSDKERGWNGYIVSREGKKVLFGGDTAMAADSFSAIRSRGPFELALMPIGAYNPWIRAHCTPEEAVAMCNAAGAKHILPIHHQAFALGREPFEEPIERFKAALQTEPERIALCNVGETFNWS